MSTKSTVANSLISDMLQDKLNTVELDLQCAIAYQHEVYKLAKRKTFELQMGNIESTYSLTQHFKYQATIAATLSEMEKTYLEYFNKPWDHKEIVQEDKPKRGRPRIIQL